MLYLIASINQQLFNLFCWIIGAEGSRLLENTNQFSSCDAMLPESLPCPAGKAKGFGWGE
ncbi:hypothetical protein GH741_05080 [Aquibacillus halophilus]|uniref:Uncharacterized protein n=1 Tax=Aquibacillus halophilus TaxID=930132 RepID=A0A6A8D8X7_9BACI|nr:hypothetical protein [Aquibacillus halophilus]